MITNLIDTTPSEKDHEYFYKWYTVPAILNKNMVASAAQSNGAIDVYRDDNGLIRVRVHRWRVTIYEDSFKTLTSAKPVVIDWLAEIK